MKESIYVEGDNLIIRGVTVVAIIPIKSLIELIPNP